LCFGRDSRLGLRCVSLFYLYETNINNGSSALLWSAAEEMGACKSLIMTRRKIQVWLTRKKFLLADDLQCMKVSRSKHSTHATPEKLVPKSISTMIFRSEI